MAEQWFEAGDLEAAKRLCGEMKHEWLMLHDLMAESVKTASRAGADTTRRSSGSTAVTDPCTWYWYKDREDIPERHWKRYGATKPS